MPAVSLARAARRRSPRRLRARPRPPSSGRTARAPASSGSGTSMAATCGLPVSRSLRSASFSSTSTNAMFSRFTCGLVAQLSIVTSCDEACALRRPGSPDGKHVRRLIEDERQARDGPPPAAMMLLRTNRSSSAKVAAGSFGERAEIADLAIGERRPSPSAAARRARRARAGRGRGRSAGPATSGRTAARPGTRRARRTARPSPSPMRT